MKKYLLTITLFLVSLSIAHSQRELININLNLNSTIKQYDILANGIPIDDRSSLNNFDADLKALLDRLEKFNASKKNKNYQHNKRRGKRKRYQYSIRYVGSKILKYYIQTQAILKYNNISWENRLEKHDISYYQQKFIDPFERDYYTKDKNTIIKESDYEEKIIRELIEEVSFQDIIWANNSELGEVIKKEERRVFNLITKNKTSKQYQYLYENYLGNQFRQEAFNNYYKLFTSDGEAMSIRNFGQLFPKETEYYPLFEALKKMPFYKDDNTIAIEVEELLKKINEKNDIKSFKNDLIKKMKIAYPKETSFLIFQKLIEEDLRDGKYCNVEKTIRQYQGIFTDESPLYKTDEKFLKLKTDLQAYFNSLEHPVIEKLNIPNNQDNTRIIFHSNGEKFFIQGNGYGLGNAQEYERDGENWKSIKNHQPKHYATLFRYFRTSNDLNQANKTDFTNATSGPDFVLNSRDLVLDMQSYTRRIGGQEYDILLFVSRSNIDRIEGKDNKNTEYNSPGNNNQQEELNARDIESSVYFHGNKEGNANTDIYYSIRLRGKTWAKFYNLGNLVNTRYAERTPVLSADGQTLYFSSEGHSGLGGLDIQSVNIKILIDEFKIEVPANVTIQNLTSFNSPYDDLSYTPAILGTTNESYFASNKDNNKFNFYFWDGITMDDSPISETDIKNLKNESETEKDKYRLKMQVIACDDPKVTVKVNGVDYSKLYNPVTKQIEGEIPLKEGDNEIVIEAEGANGKIKRKVVSIVKKSTGTGQPNPKPNPVEPDIPDGMCPDLIEIISPLKREELFFTGSDIAIQASLPLIKNRDQIEFRLNNSLRNDFSFNTETGLFNISLSEENFKVVKHKVEIIATYNPSCKHIIQREIYCRDWLPEECKEYPELCSRFVEVKTKKRSSRVTEVTGIVSDNNNNPLIGAKISFEPRYNKGKIKGVDTDSTGRYEKLLPNKYKEYSISAEGDNVLEQRYFDLPALSGSGIFIFDIKAKSIDCEIKLPKVCLFDFDKSSINNIREIESSIDAVVRTIKDRDYKIMVYGYADLQGSLTKKGSTHNCCLSKQRAKSVRNYLVNKGLDYSRIEVMGVGELNFFDDEDKARALDYALPEGRFYSDKELKYQMNRRAMIWILFVDKCKNKEEYSFPNNDCRQELNCSCPE